MPKPNKTAADYMVIALSPVLIMALVGSLCFFLIEVFYRGLMLGGVCWVMFWFIIGIVLVSRIAIEKSSEHAAVYGAGLAVATWFYMMKTQPAYLLGIVLLAIVWFCAHKLVWDCTLIDEDEDSSGQGLLQKTATPAAVNEKKEPKPAKASPRKPARKKAAPHAPGRWVVYFSVAALPLFGIGQRLLPAGAVETRRAGFIFLAVYLGAALGLLITTSFLGLRRYLRQRYLIMPPSIALAWLKFGVGVALLVLFGAIFLPRPGAGAAWATLRYQIDYQMRRASQYATAPNALGQGQGKQGNNPGGQQGNAPQPSPEKGNKPTAGQKPPGEVSKSPQANPAPMAPPPQAGDIYNLLRSAFWVVIALVIASWVFRHRQTLLAMLRSIIAAIREFLRKLLDLVPARKPARSPAPEFVRPRHSSFSEYKNPFFATGEQAWPPEQIMIYTYEAVQAWAREQGTTVRPELTAREFCRDLSGQHPDLASHFNHLARLYAYAAYGKRLPPDSDLEPIKELWRRLTVPHAVTA